MDQYAHFGYWTLVSDPWPKKVVLKVENTCICPKMPEQGIAKRDGVMNCNIGLPCNA